MISLIPVFGDKIDAVACSLTYRAVTGSNNSLFTSFPFTLAVKLIVAFGH